MNADYTIIIGLETHVQLLTQSKLFCGCSTRFGQPPNTQTCPVCIGMPGVMPVMNRRAYELALQTGIALNCEIAEFSKWDRKNYYYPDLPKGYQISQFDLPLCHDGHVDVELEEGETRRVRIRRAHLEEDAGKSMHDEVSGVADSRVDLNRTGTPLLEIVTEPDLRSPEEAKLYLTELKLLLTYIGVSDCNMQEGSLRVDANINLHIQTDDGKVATPIVEVKNMNSFRAVERALAHEAQRQYKVWQQTGQKLGDVPKQTRGWDDSAGVTKAQRQKEESSDYRYFPEPDLVPVITRRETVEQVRSEMGELPAALRTRLQAECEISAYDADVIVNQGKPLVDYYLELVAKTGSGKLASNWIQQDVLRTLKEKEITIEQFPVSAASLADLLEKVAKQKLDTARARVVFAEMIETGKPAAEIMQAKGIEKIDESELVALCEELLAANPKIVDDVKGGNTKAAGALVGQAKKKNPNVNPGRVRELCLELIEKM